MKWKFVVTLLLVMAATSKFNVRAQEKFDRTLFYHTMATGKPPEIDAEIAVVKKSALPEKNAFEGTLLMKKAGMVGGPSKKLSLFKAGHTKLEDEIRKNAANPELKFLRLMIQENAPGILGYKNDLQSDRQVIKKNFKNMLPVVQEAITNYTQKSKVLTRADLS